MTFSNFYGRFCHYKGYVFTALSLKSLKITNVYVIKSILTSVTLPVKTSLKSHNLIQRYKHQSSILTIHFIMNLLSQ